MDYWLLFKSFMLRKRVKIKSAEKRWSEKCDKKDTKQRKESLSLSEIHENYDKLPEKSRRFLKLTTWMREMKVLFEFGQFQLENFFCWRIFFYMKEWGMPNASSTSRRSKRKLPNWFTSTLIFPLSSFHIYIIPLVCHSIFLHSRRISHEMNFLFCRSP